MALPDSHVLPKEETSLQGFLRNTSGHFGARDGANIRRSYLHEGTETLGLKNDDFGTK